MALVSEMLEYNNTPTPFGPITTSPTFPWPDTAASATALNVGSEPEGYVEVGTFAGSLDHHAWDSDYTEDFYDRWWKFDGNHPVYAQGGLVFVCDTTYSLVLYDASGTSVILQSGLKAPGTPTYFTDLSHLTTTTLLLAEAESPLAAYKLHLFEVNDVVKISTGSHHIFAQKRDGRLRYWGANYVGQHGIGVASASNSPKLHPAIHFAADVAAGYDHTLTVCGLDRRVLGWGRNEYGQLGRNFTSTSENTPQTVLRTDGSPLTGTLRVFAGQIFAAALGEDGFVYCWGNNTLGECAQGNFSALSAQARQAKFTNDVPLSNVLTMAVGGGHTLVVLNDGSKSLWGWGANSQRQLSDGTWNHKSLPVPVKYQNGTQVTGVKQVAAGQSFSMALLDNGTLLAWGRNFNGQCGVNTTATSVLWPTPVVKYDNSPLEDVVRIGCGVNTGFALGYGECVYAWGHNDQGQLGSGSVTTQRNYADTVTGQSSGCHWGHSLGGGYSFSAFVADEAATVYTFGANGAGQLGTGNFTNYPYVVPTLPLP